MSTLSDRHHAILDTIWSDVWAAPAFDRLCDRLMPIIREVLAEDRDTNPVGIPVLPEDAEVPPLADVVVLLVVAWVDAISMSALPRGPSYLSDLDGDLLSANADLCELFRIGRTIGLDQGGVREIFRKLKRHRPAKLPLPREALRLLKTVGFFARSNDGVEAPDDLVEALDDGDCAYVWAYGVGYVMRREGEKRCHVEMLTRTTPVVSESGVDEAETRRTRSVVWLRERVGSFILHGVSPKQADQFALSSFRIFLSQVNLGYIEPRII